MKCQICSKPFSPWECVCPSCNGEGCPHCSDTGTIVQTELCPTCFFNLFIRSSGRKNSPKENLEKKFNKEEFIA